MKTLQTTAIQLKMDQWLEETIGRFDTELQKTKYKALSEFKDLGFPHAKMEKWRNTNLSEALSFEYNLYTEEFNTNITEEDIFQCDVHELDAFTVNLYRGHFVYKDQAIFKMDNGTIIGSLAAAFKSYPELVKKHYGQYLKEGEIKAFDLLNTALFLDGLFVYVPKNIKLEKPIQLINAVGREDNAFVQNRNLIILEEGSELTLIHCDDSYDYKRSFTNSLSEFFIGSKAKLDHIKIKNIINNVVIKNNVP
mgnify:CR=1 FL=1